jgi:hypothetical protein
MISKVITRLSLMGFAGIIGRPVPSIASFLSLPNLVGTPDHPDI